VLIDIKSELRMQGYSAVWVDQLLVDPVARDAEKELDFVPTNADIPELDTLFSAISTKKQAHSKRRSWAN
jgi:hypothetical protein